jgi:hypothetical protein
MASTCNAVSAKNFALRPLGQVTNPQAFANTGICNHSLPFK